MFGIQSQRKCAIIKKEKKKTKVLQSTNLSVDLTYEQCVLQIANHFRKLVIGSPLGKLTAINCTTCLGMITLRFNLFPTFLNS